MQRNKKNNSTPLFSFFSSDDYDDYVSYPESSYGKRGYSSGSGGGEGYYGGGGGRGSRSRGRGGDRGGRSRGRGGYASEDFTKDPHGPSDWAGLSAYM